jgi:hypothetical protein
VLGTVPVEKDGSAYFVVPARRELFFQALDADGLAVTSMRFGAQFQPGERATCHGCHEPLRQSPTAGSSVLALQRSPSRLLADVEGTNPFSYPRLVQPVLDKYCVACHREKVARTIPLDATPVNYQPGWRPTKYYASYLSLAPKYAFSSYGAGGYDDPKFVETIPGQFGARASKLYALLRKGHYDVRLPAEAMHRITVWLDSCSPFYGVYEEKGQQAQLRGEVVRPTLE